MKPLPFQMVKAASGEPEAAFSVFLFITDIDVKRVP